ncbi:hypothetical protein Tco_0210464 [Tanacetum coccineum]
MLAIVVLANDAATMRTMLAADEAAGSAVEGTLYPILPPVSPFREHHRRWQCLALNPDQLGVHCGPDDAPFTSSDELVGAGGPYSTNKLSANLTGVWAYRFNWKTELGNLKEIQWGGAILTLVSSSKDVGKDQLKQLKTTRFVGDAPATEGDVDIQDAVDLEGLSRMASEALGHDQAAVPSEDMEEREEEAVPLRRKRSVYRRARTEFNTSAFAQFHAPLSADVLPQATILNLLVQSVRALVIDKGKAPCCYGYPCEFLAEECTGRETLEKEEQAIQCGRNGLVDFDDASWRKKRALADLRYRALKGKPLKQYEVTQMMRNLVKISWVTGSLGKLLRIESPSGVPAASTHHADDPDSAGGGSFNPAGSATPIAGFAYSRYAGGTWRSLNEFFLDSDEVRADSIISGHGCCGGGQTTLDEEDVDHEGKVETIPDLPLEDFFSSESESDDDMENYIPPLPYGAFQDGRFATLWGFFIGESLHSDDVEDFWRTQDEWIVSSWKLYPKSSVHAHSSTSILSDVVIAGMLFRQFKAGLRESYECLHLFLCYQNLDGIHFPYSCWDEKWLVQEQTALVDQWTYTLSGWQRIDYLEVMANCKEKSIQFTCFNDHPHSAVRLCRIRCCKDWKLMFFNVAACFVAAGYLVSAGSLFLAFHNSFPAVSMFCGHVLFLHDRDRYVIVIYRRLINVIKEL